MKKLFAIFAGLMLVFASSSFAADASLKIGIVNLQQILQNSPQMKKMGDQLRADFSSREKKLTDEQKSLQAAIADFSKNSSVMNDDQRKKQQDKLIAQQRAFEKSQEQFQQDLIAAQNSMIKKLVDQVKSVVSQVAKKNGYDLILAESSVAYSKDGIDITKDVMKQLGE